METPWRLVLGLAVLALCGLGGVLSMRRKTSSRDKSLDTGKIPHEAFVNVYAIAGEFVIQWGLLESQIVAMISIVYHDYGGKKLDAVLPRSFGSRMEFLKVCFNQIPALDKYKLDARDVRSKAKQLVIFRDFFAHGHLYGFDPTTGVYRFHKLDNDETHTIHKQDTLDFTVKGLTQSLLRLSELFDAAWKINEGLWDGLDSTGEQTPRS